MAGVILASVLFSLTAWSTTVEPDRTMKETKKEKNSFSLTTTDVKATVGATANTWVHVTPGKGYKWNLEYPAKLTIAGVPSHVKLAKTIFKQLKGDFKATEKKASVKVAMVGTSAGTETLTGKLKLSVCDANVCHIEKADVKFTVTIAP